MRCRYDGQGGLPIKRHDGELYLTEPAPKRCVFSQCFLSGWEDTKEFQVAPDQGWVRLDANNGAALYLKVEDTPCGEGLALYRLKEATWSQPPPTASLRRRPGRRA